jgi:hypothetical protein
MFSYGFDGARTRFIHWKTGRELAFGLEKIGGVKQIFLLTDNLKLNPVENSRLVSVLERRSLKITQGNKKYGGQRVNLGHSIDLANELAREISSGVMHWSNQTRFRYKYEKIDIRRNM